MATGRGSGPQRPSTPRARDSRAGTLTIDVRRPLVVESQAVANEARRRMDAMYRAALEERLLGVDVGPRARGGGK